jgi:uncharacterized protein DUF6328
MERDRIEEGPDDAVPGDGRNETEAERNDRKWDDLLQELRVIQTSAQLTAGFLLTLPFQQSFADLSDRQERFYLVLVVLAALVTAQVLTPVAIHRRLSGMHVKGRIVSTGHLMMRLAMGSLALLVTGTVTFIFDVLVDLTAALVAGGALALVLVGLLVALPRALIRA